MIQNGANKIGITKKKKGVMTEIHNKQNTDVYMWQ